MKITVSYGQRDYGLGQDERDFFARTDKGSGQITLNIEFPLGAIGRGEGQGAGAIESSKLVLDKDEAIALASMLLSSALAEDGEVNERYFGSMTKSKIDLYRSLFNWRRDNPSSPLTDFNWNQYTE